MVHSCESLDDLKSKVAGAGGKLVVIDFFATWYVRTKHLCCASKDLI